MNAFIEFTIQVKEEDYLYLVLATLSEYPFEAFQEIDDQTLLGTINDQHLNSEIENEILTSIASWIIRIDKRKLEDKNWNHDWEQNFQPIEIDNLCRIYTPFHPKKAGFKYSLQIQPRMAFGTGHHETTRMMIRMMDSISFHGKHVLDFGCGTGILSLIASQMGAVTVLGIDIESWAVENSDENALLNNMTNTHFSGRSIQKCIDESITFDIILANIQLDVLGLHKNHIKTLLLPKGGDVIVSGVLIGFQNELESQYLEAGFVHQHTLSEGNWICQLYSVPPSIKIK